MRHERVSARRNKPKARLNAYEALLAQDRNVKLDQVQIHIPAGPRLGDVVVEADGRAQGLRRPPADRRPHLQAPARRDRRRDRPQRRRQDDAAADDHRPGAARRGHAADRRDGQARLRRPVARRARSGQDRLGGDLRRRSTRSRSATGTVNSRAYVAGFNFKGTDQQKKVGKLSGGERNRLHLAKLLRSGGNLLLLDEPTNDLDTDTLRALEEALLAFAGCAVVVSHDRWFLDRIATHVLAFEGDSQVRWFEGNFEAYESFRHEQLGAEADRPHRITYKKLVRN